MAAVVVKNGFAFWVITIDFAAKNGSLAPVATSLVVNVDALLLCLVLQPANCLETETAFGIKGLFRRPTQARRSDCRDSRTWFPRDNTSWRDALSYKKR